MALVITWPGGSATGGLVGTGVVVTLGIPFVLFLDIVILDLDPLLANVQLDHVKFECDDVKFVDDAFNFDEVKFEFDVEFLNDKTLDEFDAILDALHIDVPLLVELDFEAWIEVVFLFGAAVELPPAFVE